MEWVGITDDEWVGDMGDLLQERDQYSAARAVYRYALQLDPDDSEWLRKVGGSSGSSSGSSSYSSMRSRVLSNYTNDELWGDLGDEQRNQGNTYRASGCYGIALLLDPDDSEWPGKHTSYSGVADALEWVGITADEWIGDLGDMLVDRGYSDAARAVYRYALRLDPDDGEWQRKARGGYSGSSSSGGSGGYSGMRSRVRDNYRNDELWGDLGDEQRDQGNSYRASGCYAVARLLDPGDSEWQGKHTSYSGAAAAMEWVGITDDEWVGDMGDLVSDRGYADAARSVYRYALRLDPDDSEWQRKVGTGGT
jgi:tetratricopeptide (TPR) repeat protein